MCNACGNVCCGSDAFSGCGCDGCECEECWSEDEDLDDLDDGLNPFEDADMGAMSDAVDDMRAMDAIRKAERADAWADRETAFAVIRAAGFDVVVLSEEARHARIKIKGQGWFDFWPSSGKWKQSPRPRGQSAIRGNGVKALVAALQAVRP